MGRTRRLSRLGGTGLILIAALALVFPGLQSPPVAYAIGEASVEGATFADLVAGTVNPTYEIQFTTSSRVLAQDITITFPAGYGVRGGLLGADAVRLSSGYYKVVDVLGDSTARTITLRVTKYYFSEVPPGSSHDLTLLRGVTNPPTAGVTGSFLIETDAVDETPLTVTGVSILPVTTSTPSYLGSAPSAGGIGLLVTSRSTPTDDLVRSLTDGGCGPALIGLVQNNQWLLFIVGAPAAVNGQFPANINELTAFFVRCR